MNQDIISFTLYNEIVQEALNNGDTLAAPRENQMLINMTGVSISSKPRADGRYQGSLTVKGVGKQYFYGKTREQVAEKITIFLQEGKTPKKNKKRPTKNNAPTFGEYAEKWFEIYKKPNLKPTSLDSINVALRAAKQTLGKKQVNTITGDDVQALLVNIPAERVRCMCKIYLNQIFKKALVQGIIKFNPCDAVEIKNHKPQKKVALTRNEQEIFLEAAKQTKYDLLFRLLIATGLRIGEALALLKTDVDFEKSTVTVSKNIVFIRGKRIEQDTPKSKAGNRTVPIPFELCEELKKIETDNLFPYTYNAAKCAIDRISQNTGINVTLHVLRHTYATRLEEFGIPAKVKQYLMGHSSIEMTQNVYTDVQQDYIESISNNVRKCFDT